MEANALERAVLANNRGYDNRQAKITAAEREVLVRSHNQALARVALRWSHEYEMTGPLPGDAKPCQITSLLALMAASYIPVEGDTAHVNVSNLEVWSEWFIPPHDMAHWVRLCQVLTIAAPVQGLPELRNLS